MPRSLVAVALVAFAGVASGCVLPPFEGHSSDAWLAFDKDVPTGGREAVRSFGAAARNYGCDTEPGGLGAGSGDPRGASAEVAGDVVTVYCAEGRVALRASADSSKRVSVGCVRPMTRERCEALVREITATGRDQAAQGVSPLDKVNPAAKSP
jgi:hypothetical protein